MSARRFWIAAAALLAVMAVLQVASVLPENQTWDEGIHLASGYAYWKTGDFKWNFEHPPLFKLLGAFPLLFLNVHLPVTDPTWKNRDQVGVGAVFLYSNGIPADTILFAGRSMFILVTLGLGLAIALWTSRHFSPEAALFALFLFVLDPNFLAHGPLVTNDVMVTLFLFLAVVTWARYLESNRWRDLALAAVMAGLAMASKFSAVVLAPILACLYLVHWWRCGRTLLAWRKLSPAHFVLSMLAVALIGGLVVAAAYGPETIRCFSEPPITKYVNGWTPVGQTLAWLGERYHFPAHPFFLGLNQLANFAKDGHPQYLLGQHSLHGWWYYFPVAFAVKTPTAILLLLLLCAGLGAWRLLRPGKPLDRGKAGWATLIVPVLVYFGLSLFSTIDIGIRYLLPVYPFLFILIAGAIFELRMPWRRPVIGCAAALLLFESLAIFPHYLAFFNVPSGGPGYGPHYLADSNIDWGQDMRNLKKYLDARGWNDPVCLSYFGQANPTYYHLRYEYLPITSQVERRRALDCIAAVSVTQLVEAYTHPGAYAWIRKKQPVDKIGYSIYIYDLRKGKGR